MRKTALQCVHQLARQDKRVCFIGSDLGAGTLQEFEAEFPQRIFKEGISEQHVIGMAAGMALEGHVVYINTIASFLTRRCFEQIYLDLCLNRAKVRLLASGGGLVYAPLGPTHLCVEDFGILRPLPNITIIAPCDAQEMARLVPLTLDVEGPVYVRFAKGGDAVVSSPDTDYAIGRGVVMAEGSDVLFVTTGITAQIALKARNLLQSQGIQAGILHCHTVKPLDVENLVRMAGKVKLVVPVEEHVRTGGLYEAVTVALMQGMASPTRCRPITLPDAFFSEHGSQADILGAHGLTADNTARMVKEILG